MKTLWIPLMMVAAISSIATAQQGNLLPPQRGRIGEQAPGLNPVEPLNRLPPNNPPRTAGPLPNEGFDPSDPTQSAPDVRRILEGEQEQVRREPPPAIEVVGKVIGPDGNGKALLRINERFLIVGKGSRFTVASSFQPVVYTVATIDINGVEIQGGEENQMRLLP
ncbi:MAG: hypothetical protein R3C05_03400 [Pirellulaceae bacterium]